jgi:hypothetical protein
MRLSPLPSDVQAFGKKADKQASQDEPAGEKPGLYTGAHAGFSVLVTASALWTGRFVIRNSPCQGT